MNAFTLVGVSGAALILLAFLMNQLRYWTEEYLIYDLCNVMGSFLLILYAFLLGSWPFVVLNGVWFLVSLRDLWHDIQRNERKRSHGFFRKWME